MLNKRLWQDYLELCKPRVVSLMLLTVLVGMYLSTSHLVEVSILLPSLVGIALCAGSAAAVNHLVDKRIDMLMARTKKRPVARGRISPKQALIFAITMGSIGLFILSYWVNSLTAILSFLTLIGYSTKYRNWWFGRRSSSFTWLDCGYQSLRS